MAFGLVAQLGLAADGDTTVVQAHQEVHWNWSGNFYDTVQFPTNTNYQKVIMHYVMGCPSTGCSEWDYTTKILMSDAALNNNRFEICKVITPYAGDKQQGWYHEYKFDVTHLLPELQGQRVINAQYGGYQDGFTITVWFEFIEGTAPRTPLQVDQVYRGNYSYADPADPINSQLQITDIDKHADVDYAEFKMSATGHWFGGAGNPENCAEFCPKWYKLFVNGGQKFQQTVWRNDCGTEPYYSQTGTWVYNRAGWCPGSEAQVFTHNITDQLGSNSTFNVKVDWEGYSGTGNMNYNIGSQVIQYSAPNFNLDAEVYDVLNPSNYDRYSRYNPTAQKPKIVLRNNGTTQLGSVKLKYGVEGGTFYETTWTGVLAFMETEEVELPIPPFNFFAGTSNTFIVEILEVNGVSDEVASNNVYKSYFENIDVINGDFMLRVKTNNKAFENEYYVISSTNDTVLSYTNLTNNTTYEDILSLDTGAYTYYIIDNGSEGFDDGLSWWANSAQGNGSHQFKNVGVSGATPPLFINTLDPDFGSFFIYNFSVNYDITQGNPNYDHTVWTPPSTVGIAQPEINMVSDGFTLYPNPAGDVVYLESKKFVGRTKISVYNQVGQLVFESNRNMDVGTTLSIETTGWSKGVYLVTVFDGWSKQTIKLIK